MNEIHKKNIILKLDQLQDFYFTWPWPGQATLR